MKHIFLNNAVVIIGNIHNPSLISDNFLLKAGILKKPEDLNRNNILITPAISQLFIKDVIAFVIEPERLRITSNISNNEPFDFANKYCNALPHIKCRAVGINYAFEVSEFDKNKWFEKHNLIKIKNSKVSFINYTVPLNDEVFCNINIKGGTEDNNNAIVDFNFHHTYNETPLSELNLNFIEKWEEYNVLLEDYLTKIF